MLQHSKKGLMWAFAHSRVFPELFQFKSGKPLDKISHIKVKDVRWRGNRCTYFQNEKLQHHLQLSYFYVERFCNDFFVN